MDGGPINRREDILAVAARLFADQGFDRTTMRQIAAETGIQAASLYHHFATKDDILHGLIRDFVEGLPNAYRRLIAEHGDPAATVRAFVIFALRIALEDRIRLSVVNHERGRPGFAYLDETLREVRTIWLGVISDGLAKGVFRSDLNPHVVIRMMMDLVGSAAKWVRPDSRRYTLDEVVTTELGFIFDGINAR
jgi:AcrR family transcriptional regulator